MCALNSSLIRYLLNYLFKMQLYESEERLQFILKIDFFVSKNIEKYCSNRWSNIFEKDEQIGYLFFFSSIFESFHGFQWISIKEEITLEKCETRKSVPGVGGSISWGFDSF